MAMTTHAGRIRARWAVVAPIAAAVLALAACSSGGGGASNSPAPPANTIPSSTIPTNPGPAATTSASSQASGRSGRSGSSVDAARAVGLPRPSHIVVVVEENHAAAEIIGSSAAPYINALARSGASFTHSYAITHPSEPNYLALFSGSTQGLTDDSCPHSYRAANLGSRLRAAGKGFIGYSEGLPHAGSMVCTAGNYARRHVPWTDFPALPAEVNQPFSAFPSNYSKLPRLSFVIPNLQHDMHDGTIGQGDRWLRGNLRGYVRWAHSHNSLLVLTWDEDDTSHGNRIPTVIVGAHVRRGRYGERVTHYRLLRTLLALEGLGPIGRSASTRPITDIWTAR